MGIKMNDTNFERMIQFGEDNIESYFIINVGDQGLWFLLFYVNYAERSFAFSRRTCWKRSRRILQF